MARHQLDISIEEAGSLLYLADRNFGGLPINRFHEFFGGVTGLKELTIGGAVIAASLYQDDGYSVRIVFGELEGQEISDWTSKLSWKLDLKSGQMIVSGICNEEMDDYLAGFPTANDGGSYELGTIVNVSPGEYSVSIYSYPPNDLAGGWMRLENKGFFRDTFGKEAALAFEEPIDYFKRTRPGEIPCAWIAEGFEEGNFLDFIIQMNQLTETPPLPKFEDDGCVEWEYRKPEVCPTGINLD